MKMTVTRVLAHGEGDPVVTIGGATHSSDHGTQPQKIHQYEVSLDGDNGYARLMFSDEKEASIFVEGEMIDVRFSPAK